MQLKIPPGIQLLFFAFIMWLINIWLPIIRFEFKAQGIISWALFIIALLLIILAIISFFKAKTTTDPTKPEKVTKLVNTGIYKISRNPMYLAMLLILISFVIKMGNLFTIIGPVLFVFSITRFQIKPEEKVLTKKFGQVYIDYCKKIRRWI